MDNDKIWKEIVEPRLNKYNEKRNTNYGRDDIGCYLGTVNKPIVFPKKITKYAQDYYSIAKRNRDKEQNDMEIYIEYLCDMYEESVKKEIPFEWYIELYKG